MIHNSISLCNRSLWTIHTGKNGLTRHVTHTEAVFGTVIHSLFDTWHYEVVRTYTLTRLLWYACDCVRWIQFITLHTTNLNANCQMHFVLVQSRRMSLRGETGPFTESHPQWLDWFIRGVYPCTPPQWMDWFIHRLNTRLILCTHMPTHVCALSWPYPAEFNQCNCIHTRATTCIQPTSRNSTVHWKSFGVGNFHFFLRLSLQWPFRCKTSFAAEPLLH